MPRAKTRAEFNKNISGIVTDASLVDFAPSASRDEENFLLNPNGNRFRRLGLDYEDDFDLVSLGLNEISLSSSGISTHSWESTDINGEVFFILVIQVGLSLYFFDESAATISKAPLNGGNALAITGDATRQIETAVVNDLLVVVNGGTTINVLEYEPVGDTVTGREMSIEIRDIYGVDDGLEIDQRPASLSNLHRYNLLNQGWTSDLINTFKTEEGVYPSNADVVFLGKDETGSFDASHLVEQFFGSTPAPKGRYIIDALSRGSSRGSKSSVSGLPGDITLAGFGSVAAFSGRVFFAGGAGRTNGGDDNSPSMSNTVAFSQIVSGDAQIKRCYQDADPTSEHVSDLVDTDGGTIKIAGAQRISKLLVVGNSLLVFANNGVWQILGSELGGGFNATGFQIVKITDAGPVNAASVVAVDNFAMYWANSGIYVLTVGEAGTGLQAVNLTENRIQELYKAIPDRAKKYVKGVYDTLARKVMWLYNDNPDETNEFIKVRFNKELIYDLTTNGFTKNAIQSLDDETPYVSGYITGQKVGSISVASNVVVGNSQVKVGLDDVIIGVSLPNRNQSDLKYLTFKSSGNDSLMTFSIFKNTSFRDWYTADGIGKDAKAFLTTGPLNFGDNTRDKQADYFYVQMLRTESGYTLLGDGSLAFRNPSSCLAQARFDHTDSVSSGKWTPLKQVYRIARNYLPKDFSDSFDYGHELIMTKNRLRGTGRAITLHFETEADKDLKLLGWSLAVSGGTGD